MITYLKIIKNEEIDDHIIIIISEIQEPKITGKILGNAVAQLWTNIDFNFNNCVGIGT